MNTDNLKDLSNDEIDFTEIFTALWKKKLLIFLITSSAAVFSVVYSLSLPNIYISSALGFKHVCMLNVMALTV